MIILTNIFFYTYIASIFIISLYCSTQLVHLFYYLKNKSKSFENDLNNDEKHLPFITIQLPIFNEKYVIETLVESITKLDYPKDKFEIHILDDSTDETTTIAQRAVQFYSQRGYNIKLFHRNDRDGFKAGALRDATPFSNGEFLVIFDADFIPYPDFLKKTLPSFNQENIGVVQTRWDHLNQNSSLLTELQAFQLNVHFTVEQSGRYKAGHFLQFNGTAGIWRKSCIIDSGGWQADTLTEDLDLSYRAQLKEWEIVYLEGVTVPAELPSDIYGLKSQQFRWMKGGAENAKKLLRLIWLSQLNIIVKVTASLHLLSSSVFLFVFLLSISSVCLVFSNNFLEESTIYLEFFFFPTFILMSTYFIANVLSSRPNESIISKILKFVILFPTYMSMSMAMGLNNSVAVIQGLLGKKSSFVRTPKTGFDLKKDKQTNFDYNTSKIGVLTIIEGILSLIILAAVIKAFFNGHFDFLLIHLMLTFGYSYLFILSIRSDSK